MSEFQRADFLRVGILLFFFVTLSGARAELISYWPLDGELNDAAPSGSKKDHGRFIGKASYADGVFGKAIVLDGSNFVSIPTSLDLEAAGEALTIVAWFRVDRWDELWQTLLSKGEGTNYRIARASASSEMLSFAGGGSGLGLDLKGGSVNDGEWHQVVAVTGSDSPRLFFVDGKLVESRTPAELTDNGSPLQLGANPQKVGEREWIGAIDDVGLFSIGLNQHEAEALHFWATNRRYGYDLGDCAKLLKLHREKAKGAARVGPTSWQFADRAPSDDTPFVKLSESGTGVVASLRPVIITFETTERFIATGESATLRWEVSDDATLSITPTPGNLTKHVGSVDVGPNQSTTYTITATNEHGQTKSSVTVHVDYTFGQPRITEFMADSDGVFRDGDDDASDWIEIGNPSDKIATLEGLFLTDSVKKLRRWKFPEAYLEPGDRIVIFASGKDRRVPGAPFHTNFKLGTKGEYLALSDGRQALSSFGEKYPNQKRGTSYGVSPQGEVGFLATPTPNAENADIATSQVSDVQFGFDRSIREEPFDLGLMSATPEAVIFFTTDGSVPTAENGTRYRKPIRIEGTKVVRAIATKPGLQSTTVTTHTYVFPAEVAKQPSAPEGAPLLWGNAKADYEMDPDVAFDDDRRASLDRGLRALPALSISLPSDDLFGDAGIYSNPERSGRDWERAASLELIHPDGARGFQIDCGLRIQGGYGRKEQYLKHSLRVLFKREYGETKLKHPVFEDPEATTSFDTLTLRAGFNNTWHRRVSAEAFRSQYLRDEFMRRSQLAMGQPSSHGLFVHVYLNGLYWGLYNLVERPSAPFAAAYLGGDKEDYDALNSGNAVDGTPDSWLELFRRLSGETGNGANLVEDMGKFIDMENFIDYLLLNYYGGNSDWDHHNWYAARKREDDAGFRFFSWDAERTLEDLEVDVTERFVSGNPTSIFRRLIAYPKFQAMVAKRVNLHFFDDGALTPKKAGARYAALAKQIEDAVVAESARWGDSQRERPFTRNEFWIPERDRLLETYFPERTDVVLQQLNAARIFDHVQRPRLRRVGRSVELLAKMGTVYYTIDGSDPRLAEGKVNPAAKVLKGGVGNQTILAQGSLWKYLDDGSDQGTKWDEPGFDDSKWKRGRARLGYGRDGEATTIGFGPDPGNKFITTYFRKKVDAPAGVKFDVDQVLRPTRRRSGRVCQWSGGTQEQRPCEG